MGMSSQGGADRGKPPIARLDVVLARSKCDAYQPPAAILAGMAQHIMHLSRHRCSHIVRCHSIHNNHHRHGPYVTTQGPGLGGNGRLSSAHPLRDTLSQEVTGHTPSIKPRYSLLAAHCTQTRCTLRERGLMNRRLRQSLDSLCPLSSLRNELCPMSRVLYAYDE